MRHVVEIRDAIHGAYRVTWTREGDHLLFERFRGAWASVSAEEIPTTTLATLRAELALDIKRGASF